MSSKCIHHLMKSLSITLSKSQKLDALYVMVNYRPQPSRSPGLLAWWAAGEREGDALVYVCPARCAAAGSRTNTSTRLAVTCHRLGNSRLVVHEMV